MGGTETTPPAAMSMPELDALIDELERNMPELQMRNGNVFAFANAWAARYDAIIAVTPPVNQADVAARLSRIGIRWGVAPGARVTSEFHALKPELLPQDWRRGPHKSK